MSRVSLSRRLAAILEAAERVDPVAARVHRMKPAVRARFEAWQAECACVVAEHGDPADVYAAYLETDEWPMPPPPADVARALGLEAAPVLVETMSDADLADLWRRMCEAD